VLNNPCFFIILKENNLLSYSILIMPPKRTKKKAIKKKKTKKPIKRVNNANNTQRVTVNVNSNNSGGGQNTEQFYDAIKSSYGSLQPAAQPIDLNTPLLMLAQTLKSGLGNAAPLDPSAAAGQAAMARAAAPVADPFHIYDDLGESASVVDYAPLSRAGSVLSDSKTAKSNRSTMDREMNQFNQSFYDFDYDPTSKTLDMTPLKQSPVQNALDFINALPDDPADGAGGGGVSPKKSLKQMKSNHQLFEHPKASGVWYEKAEVEQLYYNDDKDRDKKNRLRNYLNYGKPDPSKKDKNENELYAAQKEAWHNSGNDIPTKLEEIWPHKLQLIQNRTNAKGQFHDSNQQLPKKHTFD
jgi:hypothetical protein